MPMLTQCQQKVESVIGRKLKAGEADQFKGMVQASMNHLARKDPATWGGLTYDQKVEKSSQLVANSIRAAAKAKLEARLKEVVAQDKLYNRIEREEKVNGLHSFQAVASTLRGIYGDYQAIMSQYKSNCYEQLRNAIGTKYFGLVENRADVEDFVRAAFGEKVQNTKAKAAWDAFNDNVQRPMLNRLRAAGIDVGELDYGHLPQSHDMIKVAREDKGTWVKYMEDAIDKRRYTDPATGNQMSDLDIHKMLERVYDDIVTDSNPDSSLQAINKKLRPKPKNPFLGNGNAYTNTQHRVIHFKDAKSYLDYQYKYGKGDGVMGAIDGQINGVSRQIAVAEAMGPNPHATFEWLEQLAGGQRDARVGEIRQQRPKSNSKVVRVAKNIANEFEAVTWSDRNGLTGVKIRMMWDVLTGQAGQAAPGRESIAAFFQGWRNLEVAGKLGKAFISSFSDIPNYFIVTGMNRVGFTQSFDALFRAFGSDWKEYGIQLGLIADSMSADMNKWAESNLGGGWTAKCANLTMKASFLEAWTDGIRRAFAMVNLASLARLASNDWASLSKYDQARLERGGITEKEWQMIKAVGIEDHKGVKFVNPKLIERNGAQLQGKFTDDEIIQAPAKILKFILTEAQTASIGPDLTTMAGTTRGLQKGTVDGELYRGFFLFKSFPIAVMERHLRNLQFLKRNAGRGEALKYAAACVTTTTIFGAISLQIQQLLNGQDEMDMGSREFWESALAKGGGLGFLGDFFVAGLSEDAKMGAYSMANLAGPMAGTGIQAWDLGKSIVGEALYDKQAKPGQRATTLVRSHLPFLNLWYTSLALDRAVLDNMQEWLSPGRAARLQSRANRTTGQGYWWRPGAFEPSRAPRFATDPTP